MALHYHKAHYQIGFVSTTVHRAAPALHHAHHWRVASRPAVGSFHTLHRPPSTFPSPPLPWVFAFVRAGPHTLLPCPPATFTAAPAPCPPGPPSDAAPTATHYSVLAAARTCDGLLNGHLAPSQLPTYVRRLAWCYQTGAGRWVATSPSAKRQQ